MNEFLLKIDPSIVEAKRTRSTTQAVIACFTDPSQQAARLLDSELPS